MPRPIITETGNPKGQMIAQQEIMNWVYEHIGNYLRVSPSPFGWDELGPKFDELITKVNDVLLEVEDDATSSDIAGVVAKLDELKSELVTANTSLVNINNVVSTEVTLLLCKTLLEEIRNKIPSIPEHTYIIGEGWTEDSHPSGFGGTQTFVVPFYKISKIRRLYVRQISGNIGQDFTVVLYRKNPSTGIDDQDIIYYSDDFNTNTKKEDDTLYEQDIAFKNVHDLDEIYLQITPGSGTSNNFFYLIDGFKLVI